MIGVYTISKLERKRPTEARRSPEDDIDPSCPLFSLKFFGVPSCLGVVDWVFLALKKSIDCGLGLFVGGVEKSLSWGKRNEGYGEFYIFLGPSTLASRLLSCFFLVKIKKKVSIPRTFCWCRPAGLSHHFGTSSRWYRLLMSSEKSATSPCPPSSIKASDCLCPAGVASFPF